ncbi:MAG: hypothetical protein M3Q07_28210 [Pseudobdellovibrionaceae bacterium]|nr:hypothetical protein [Pseudobdellovibrionaceae bacterium]
MKKFAQNLSKSLFISAFLFTACGSNSSDNGQDQLQNPVSIKLQGQSYVLENKALDYDKGEPCYLYQIQFLYDAAQNKCIAVNVDRDWQTLGENSARITWKLNTLDGLTYKQFEQIFQERWITDGEGKLYCSFYQGPVQNGVLTGNGLYYFLTRKEAATVKDLEISETAFIGAAPDTASCEVLLKP